MISLLVNGFRIKIYSKLMEREEFTNTMRAKKLDVISRIKNKIGAYNSSKPLSTIKK
jgi:hypothetical protein